jgi:hypothetical protein
MNAQDPIPPQSGPGALSAASFRRPAQERLSDLLARSVTGTSDRVTVGELVRRLSARGLAPLVMMVGLLNIVTIIPGSSTIMGLPLVFLGISLLIGARRVWLPKRLRTASFDRAGMARTVERALPHVRRIERMAHPRFWPGGDVVLDRIYGALVLFLALLVTLPIPFGNAMPAAAIVLLSLGFTTRDGLWVAAGLAAAAVALGIIASFIGAVGFAGLHFFR